MVILAWIIIGLITGWPANVVCPDVKPGGMLATLIIGVIGAFVGGWLFQAFGGITTHDINLYSILIATLGSIVFLFIWEALAAGRTY